MKGLTDFQKICPDSHSTDWLKQRQYFSDYDYCCGATAEQNVLQYKPGTRYRHKQHKTNRNCCPPCHHNQLQKKKKTHTDTQET